MATVIPEIRGLVVLSGGAWIRTNEVRGLIGVVEHSDDWGDGHDTQAETPVPMEVLVYGKVAS
jgi:hypothetical protein